MQKLRFSKNLKFYIVMTVLIGMALSGFTVSRVFAEGSLISDLEQSSSYARQSIDYLSNRNIIMGDLKGNFYPGQNITRAQMITIIVRSLGLDITNIPGQATFKDVPKSHWANPYVETAYREGIVTGISSDLFGVNDLCTREQMTVMFVRALGVSYSSIHAGPVMENVNNLSDRKKISNWAVGYVEFALETGLMTGTGGSAFDPKSFARREQAAVVTHRFLSNKDIIMEVTTTDEKELTIKEVIALEESVVLVETYDQNGLPMAQGSGFYIGNGLFMTNYHVLEGASYYVMTTNGGKQIEAAGIVRYDRDLDLAIVKSQNLVMMQPLKIGSRGMVEKGDKVVAIGNPLGFQNTVSDGIVSGFREFTYGDNGIVNIVQFTAPITNGSSGGALFNMQGYVIGVTSSGTDDGSLFFAVAIDHAKSWIQELKAKAFKDITVLDMQDEIDAYMKVSEADIKNTVYKAFRALEEEDINAYMALIHKFNPTYGALRDFYLPLFKEYDMDYTLSRVDLLEKSYDTAKVSIKYSAKRALGPSLRDMEIIGYYTLSKYDGEWKIYQVRETLLHYLEGDTGNGNVGGVMDNVPGTVDTGDISSSINGSPLTFQVSDTFLHPEKPVIFVTDMNNSKVVSYNYETKEVQEASFDLAPERLTYYAGEVYVTLLKGKHSPYWWPESQEGAIAILDGETLAVKEQFDIDIDPFDIIAGRDGYLYIPSGSGQTAPMKSYSRQTLQEVSKTTIRNRSQVELHPTLNKIYTITSDISPRDMSAYRIANGVFLDGPFPGGIDSPYHGDYAMYTNFRISPDGKYIFNGAGTIFSCVLNNLGVMNYYGKISKPFIDIAFDLAGNRFFTGTNGGFIYEYDYATFKSTNTYKVQGEIVALYHRSGKLIALTKVNSKYYIEVVNTAE